MKLRRFYIPALVLGLLALASAAAISGCQTDPQTGVTSIGGLALPTTQQVQSARDQADATLKATTQAVQDVKDQLQTLPATDPVRKTLEAKLDELQKLEPKLQQAIDLFDAANRTVQSGQLDPSLGSAASGLFGVYGGLAVSLVGLGFGIYQRIQAGKQAAIATQAVKSAQVIVDAAGGVPPAAVAEVNKIQDETTRKFVDQVQASLAPAVAPATPPAA